MGSSFRGGAVAAGEDVMRHVGETKMGRGTGLAVRFLSDRSASYFSRSSVGDPSKEGCRIQDTHKLLIVHEGRVLDAPV